MLTLRRFLYVLHRLLLTLYERVRDVGVLLTLLRMVNGLVLYRLISASLIVRANGDDRLLVTIRFLNVRPFLRFDALNVINVIRNVSRRRDLLIKDSVAAGDLARRLKVAVCVRRVVLRLRDRAGLLTGLVRVIDVLDEDVDRSNAGLRNADRGRANLRTGRLSVFLFLRVVTILGLRVVLLSLSGLGNYDDGRLRRLNGVLVITLYRSLMDRRRRAIAERSDDVNVPLLICDLVAAARIDVVRRIIIRRDVIIVNLGDCHVRRGLLEVVLRRVMSRRRWGETGALSAWERCMLRQFMGQR